MGENVELIASYWTIAGGADPHTDHEYSVFDFKDRVEACARAGFKGFGIWHADLAYTLQRTSLAEMKRILDDNGMKYIELEFIGDWFLTGEKKKKSAAAAQLRETNPEIVFLVLGEGAEKERIVALARKRGLNNLQFVDQQPREKIPAYIGASDVCLVLLKKTDLFKTVIPTKMLEFMSCGRPVILGVDGQARSILEDAGGGLVIEPENSQALVNAILYLAANRETARDLGQNGRKYIVRKFSRRQTAEEYIRVLERVLNLPERRSTEVAA